MLIHPKDFSQVVGALVLNRYTFTAFYPARIYQNEAFATDEKAGAHTESDLRLVLFFFFGREVVGFYPDDRAFVLREQLLNAFLQAQKITLRYQTLEAQRE